MGWVSFLEDLQKIRDEAQLLFDYKRELETRKGVTEAKVKSFKVKKSAHEKRLREVLARIDRYLEFTTDPSFDLLRAFECQVKKNHQLEGEIDTLKNDIKKLIKSEKEANQRFDRCQDKIKQLEQKLLPFRFIDSSLSDAISEETKRRRGKNDLKMEIITLKQEVKKKDSKIRRLQDMLSGRSET